jgi:lactoylglutathione lyase
MTTFKGVYPISDEDTSALPVKEIAPAVAFYEKVLGFSVVASDQAKAVLQRDEARIGLIRDPNHDPATAGSCYIEVDDVQALRGELQANGAKPGSIEVQQHNGKRFRVFFVRECDMMDVHDGYCFCFGQPV